MRVVWSGAMYPPIGGGAEWTAHEFLLACLRAGHEAIFWHHHHAGIHEFEGVPIVASPPRRCDVVIGHLGHAIPASRYAAHAGAGWVWMLHASNQRAMSGRPDVVLVNSRHVQERVPGSWLMRPHCPRWRYAKGRTGNRVTLVNLSRWKGVDLFARLVERRPDVAFLGVRGAWDEQRYRAGRYANLTVWDCQPEIGVVLAATRVLLMPSSSESWGRIGVEAACRGIPTIAHPCTGIEESLGDAAVYADRSDAAEWSSAIDGVLASYAHRSRLARQRAVALERQTSDDQARIIKRLEDTFG